MLQYPQNTILARKLCPNWKFYLLLKNISSLFHFVWLLGFALSVYDQTIGFKGSHVYEMKLSYKNEGGGFKADTLCK